MTICYQKVNIPRVQYNRQIKSDFNVESIEATWFFSDASIILLDVLHPRCKPGSNCLVRNFKALLYAKVESVKR